MTETTEYKLTNDQFDEIDCSEAVLNLNYGALPTSTVRLGVWGIIFHIRDHALPVGSKVSSPVEIEGIGYLPAWSTITFNGVTKLDLKVNPYAPRFRCGGELRHIGDGTEELIETWLMQVSQSPSYNYGFDCVLDHPFGYCSLTIHATGVVNLTFNPERIIPFSEFQSQPSKFGWWENGRLQV